MKRVERLSLVLRLLFRKSTAAAALAWKLRAAPAPPWPPLYQPHHKWFSAFDRKTQANRKLFQIFVAFKVRTLFKHVFDTHKKFYIPCYILIEPGYKFNRKIQATVAFNFIFN